MYVIFFIQNIIKKEGSLMGSLKRFVGGMQNTTPQSKCETSNVFQYFRIMQKSKTLFFF